MRTVLNTLTISNWYLGAEYRVELFRASDGKVLDAGNVNTLVSKMAGYATLPTQMDSALLELVGTYWHT